MTLPFQGSRTSVFSRTGCVQCGPGQKLTNLQLWVEASVNIVFISPITLFHELVELPMRSPSLSAGGRTFGFPDGDIAEVATVLPNLVDVSFGYVCPANSCQTTLSSLLFISIRCKNLAA